MTPKSRGGCLGALGFPLATAFIYLPGRQSLTTVKWCMRRDWHQIKFEFDAYEISTLILRSPWDYKLKHDHVSLMVMDQPAHWFWVVSWCKQSVWSGSTHFLLSFTFPICTGTILLHFYGLPFSPFGHGSVTYPNSLAPTLPSFLDCSWLQLSSAFEVATA